MEKIKKWGTDYFKKASKKKLIFTAVGAIFALMLLLTLIQSIVG